MCWGTRCSGQLLQAVKQPAGAIFPWQTEGRVVRGKEGAMRSPSLPAPSKEGPGTAAPEGARRGAREPPAPSIPTGPGGDQCQGPPGTGAACACQGGKAVPRAACAR